MQMRRFRTAQRAPSASRRRRGLLPALVAFACACAFVVQAPGWAQTSYMALSKAFLDGTPQIDKWHWESHDVAYTDGHYYSVKPPGLSIVTLPLYAGLRKAGGEGVARDARIRGESHGNPWGARTLPTESYGYSRKRAIAARAVIADDAPMVWALGLLGVLVPALILLVVVRRMVERVSPGTGTAAALTLGVGTMILPFSTLYFSHVLSALLAFGAFALLWREREREGGREGAARPLALAGAGLLAGLAVVFEYPLLIAAAIIGLYAITRRGGSLIGRAGAYGGGVAAGTAPLLAYNVWAFGSPFHLSYENAVARVGKNGHATLGLNDGGIFGITFPRIGDGLELLFSGRGLLTLTPVIVLAIAGVIVMYRDGRHRTEARVILAIAIAFFVYNAGYWLPLGGGSPGPRFLIPILPFLAIGLGLAWRRWPAVTLALSAISATSMAVATISYPMIGLNDPGEWLRRLFDYKIFQHSVLDLTGIAHGLPAIAPFALIVALALGLGAATLGRHQLAVGARHVPAAVGIWALCAIVLPRPLQLPSAEALILIGVSAAIALLAVAGPWLLARSRSSAQPEEHHAGAPLSLEVQAAQRSS